MPEVNDANDNDLHPYYKRKARKNAEFIDYVVTHWWQCLLVALAIGFISDALS